MPTDDNPKWLSREERERALKGRADPDVLALYGHAVAADLRIAELEAKLGEYVRFEKMTHCLDAMLGTLSHREASSDNRICEVITLETGDLLAKLAEREGEIADLQSSFDLRWKADMRAIERWREAGTGRELTLPDHADLCVWLFEQVERFEGIETSLRNVLADPTLRNNVARLEKKLSEHDSEIARLLEALEPFQKLLDAMETCHICHATVMVEEGPIHCQDCPSDCGIHPLPDCTSIRQLHAEARAALHGEAGE